MRIFILGGDYVFTRRDEELFKELGYDVEYITYQGLLSSKKIWKHWLLACPIEVYKKARKADVLFSWWATSYDTVILSKLVKKPCIIVAGGSEVELDKRLPIAHSTPASNFLINMIVRFTLTFADKVISCGDYIKQNADKLSKNTTNEVVYNTVDTQIFKRINGVGKKPYIVTVGIMRKDRIETKGFIPLLEAFSVVSKNHPEYKLVYLGNGDERFENARPVLRKKARELGVLDKIIFMDFPKTQEEYAYFLNQCKVYVQYSLHEGCPVAVIEAMACGIPSVVSDHPGVVNSVGNAGLIVELKNTVKLAENIEMLIEDKKLYTRLSKKGVERVGSMFSKEIRKRKLKAIVEGLVKSKKNT